MTDSDPPLLPADLPPTFSVDCQPAATVSNK